MLSTRDSARRLSSMRFRQEWRAGNRGIRARRWHCRPWTKAADVARSRGRLSSLKWRPPPRSSVDDCCDDHRQPTGDERYDGLPDGRADDEKIGPTGLPIRPLGREARGEEATARRQHHYRIAVVRVDPYGGIDGRVVLTVVTEDEGVSRRWRVEHGAEAPDVCAELAPVRLAHAAQQIGVEGRRRSVFHMRLHPSDHVADTGRKARRARRRVLEAWRRAPGCVIRLCGVGRRRAFEA